MIPSQNYSIYPSSNFDGNLEFRTAPIPELEPQELLIQVEYFALNRADLLQLGGVYPPPAGAPLSLGLECSGRVVATGEKVTKWKAGDVVSTLVSGGAYARYCISHQDLCLDANIIGLEKAASIPEAFISAFFALFNSGHLIRGCTILIHAGASGVGQAAIQLAKEESCIVATTCSASKMETCKEIGADIVIDYTNQDFRDKIQTFTNGKGVDYILDFIGPNYWSRNIDCLSKDGQMIMMGLLSGFESKDPFYLGKIIMNRLKIQGITLRSQNLDNRIKLISSFQEKYWSKITSGQLSVKIDSIYDWKDINRAIAKMKNNLNQGKILCRVTD